MRIRVIYTSILVFCFNGLVNAQIITGAEQTEKYLPKLIGKNIALVVNPTSIIDDSHLVDSLLSLNISITTIFAPEHGFRGNEDAGAHVANGKDNKTGLPIISLYGSNKKPSKEQLEGVDIVVFDIQDVGARFYTYISTMHYVMEACAENNIKLLILDRPNPNGMYVDGPVRKDGFESFVGKHPIPVLHGLTIGELSMMINGEKWLEGDLLCDVEIVKCKKYEHSMQYKLPVKPSPNLPNSKSIALYPSLCFFEGTNVSVGRGTYFPFQVYGHPNWGAPFNFTPKSLEGATDPPYKSEVCKGFDLRNTKPNGFTLSYLITAYNLSPEKSKFFSSVSFFNRLAGNDVLIQQIKNGLSEQEIRESWEPELSSYKELRKAYLLYP